MSKTTVLLLLLAILLAVNWYREKRRADNYEFGLQKILGLATVEQMPPYTLTDIRVIIEAAKESLGGKKGK